MNKRHLTYQAGAVKFTLIDLIARIISLKVLARAVELLINLF